MSDEYIKLLQAFGNLETHICNFIANLQHGHRLTENQLSCLTKPLSIDDSNLRTTLEHFKGVIKTLTTELSGAANQFVKKMKECNVSQYVAETKYIGNRLKNIETILQEIKESGLKNDLKIKVTLDNKDLLPDENGEEEIPTSVYEKKLLTELRNILGFEYPVVFSFRYGLNSKPKSSLKKSGEAIEVSPERARQLCVKCLRTIRSNEKTKDLVKKINNDMLTKDVFGEFLD